jgi:hypothetical protein
MRCVVIGVIYVACPNIATDSFIWFVVFLVRLMIENQTQQQRVTMLVVLLAAIMINITLILDALTSHECKRRLRALRVG